MKKLIALTFTVLLLTSCATSSDVFTPIGANIGSPSAMWVDTASNPNRLYLVNSNDDVLYADDQGSFQVYDITNPLAPTLINTAQTLSFSGQIYIDTATNRAYVPNRYTANDGVIPVVMYNFDINEASANFITPNTSTLNKGAFGISCCYPAGRLWITTRNQELQYVDMGGDLAPGSLSLVTTLDNGSLLSPLDATFITIIGNQAFVSREAGGVMVINLDQVGVAGAVPVNYFIYDVYNPIGITNDGTNIYVAGQGQVGDNWVMYLDIINVSTLTATTTNTNTAIIGKSDAGRLVAEVTVGNNPQQPLLTTDYVFVTNFTDNTVSVIRRSDNTVVQTISVGNQPFAMALYRTTGAGAADKYVYVGNLQDNSISIIDIATLSVVATYQ